MDISIDNTADTGHLQTYTDDGNAHAISTKNQCVDTNRDRTVSY